MANAEDSREISGAFALGADAAETHEAQSGGPAVLALLRRLRRALRTGQSTVQTPTILVADATPHVPAAAMRATLVHRLQAAVRAGSLSEDEGRLLVERFGLDGVLRRAGDVSVRGNVGRETMRTRYHAAAAVLADRIAAMPLNLDPEVGFDNAERELRIALALAERTPPDHSGYAGYVQARVRSRLLGEDAPGPPGRGRAEDRRWQRAADQVTAAVETDLVTSAPLQRLASLSDADVDMLRRWFREGNAVTSALNHEHPAISSLLLCGALHGQLEVLRHAGLDEAMSTDDGDVTPIDIVEVTTSPDDILGMAATVATARDLQVSDPVLRTAIGVIQRTLAEQLAEDGFQEAAEHVMRLDADTTDGLIALDDVDGLIDVERCLETFAIKRYRLRVALSFARGPQTIATVRETLRDAAAFSSRRPHGIDYAEAVRFHWILQNVECAALLAGAPVDGALENYERFCELLNHTPFQPRLISGLDEALAGAERVLRKAWSNGGAIDPTQATFVHERAAVVSPSRTVLRRWTHPR